MNGCGRVIALTVVLTLAGGQCRAESETGYSAAGLYNLANSYARAGQPGMAVLNYKRAALLAPNDPDIDANLRFVLASAQLPTAPRGGFDRVAKIASPPAVAWIGVIGLVILGAGALAAQLSSRLQWPRRGAMGVGAAMIALTVCDAVVLWPTLHEGIVIKAATPVRVAPAPMGDSLFVLPEAEIVRITTEHEGFVLIQTKAGRAGWVSRTSIAPVVPQKWR
jgi:hypothetical protein